MKMISVSAVAVVFAFSLFFSSRGYPIGLGDMTPDFTVETMEGTEMSYYADIRGRKPLYLVFWATW